MDWEAKLIFIDVTVCQFFLQDSSRNKLRKSPNKGFNFTDEEVIAIYIFEVLHGFRIEKFKTHLNAGKKLAGFVLVQRGPPISDDTKVWEQFQGAWQVRVLIKNQFPLII